MPKPSDRKKPKPVPGPIARNLRAKIEGCGLSYSKIAEFAGVAQPQITKFMLGSDINLATAEKLLETLDEVYAALLSAQAEIAEIARNQKEEMRAVILYYTQIDKDLAQVKDALAVLGRFIETVEGKPEVRP
jgi:transcriptional regulator with XRE-family HTH domain